MNLHVQRLGAGPDLVMLHGWGLHGGIFTEVAEQLAQRFRISLIDLPGHGRSPQPEQMLKLSTLTDMVAAAAPTRATWLGWSLGGMIAAQLALTAPAQVENLIMVCTSPRFVTADDWPCAMDPAVLTGFAQALQEDYHGTLERFLSLQIAPGTAKGRHNLRQLREMMQRSPMPAEQALRDGLGILCAADLRLGFAALHRPALLILGERDSLVPACVAPAIGALASTLRIEVIKGAGHVPFLSHPRAFLAAVSAFWDDHHG
ncbi:MAG: pimeloyl-ACP methyl ester esterase BioH [Gammaproteobacteria bacterium]